MIVYVLNLSKQTCNTKMLKRGTNHISIVDLENVIGKNENNIFFIESNSKLSKFHPRILCAFESAAIHNPDERV